MSNLVRSKRIAMFFAVVIILLVVPSAWADPIAMLTMQSQPGDYIGQGQSYNLTYTGSDIVAQVIQTVAGSPAEIDFILWPTTNPFALLYFGTNQLGTPLEVGSYTDAQRAAFAAPGHAGLDVSFDHRGSNTLTGSFDITQLVIGPGNTIQTFQVNFIQHSEGFAPALSGTFTYYANGIPVSEPSSLAFIGTGLLGLMAAFRKKLTARV